MKCDMDLLRNILLKIEEGDFRGIGGYLRAGQLQNEIENFTSEEVQYHYMLLYNFGFITAINGSNDMQNNYIPLRLTIQGYELLDTARNQDLWNSTKKAVEERGGNVPMAVIQTLLFKAANEDLGLE